MEKMLNKLCKKEIIKQKLKEAKNISKELSITENEKKSIAKYRAQILNNKEE
ncbi:hypothetical protein [Anaerosalibacter sp. Marseille-P3206]|uniref:hypothetical protein n=1 Tax=Anaerosalibacter sp. Marseille-P3206 TaxID=1871005 RepID=UPI0013564E40|nr:hypothetical protein [Anaerosalibacter sp. Marseille-P3206]